MINGKRKYVWFLVSLTLAGTLAVVGFGQACAPAFAPRSSIEAGSLGNSEFLTEPQRQACGATGIKPNVDSIESLVAFINTLPRPVQLHCLIAQLPRPLHVQAGVSVSSAQPSSGPRNPRILIRILNLLLTVVPDGTAKNTLEISELASGTLWDRAEFVFPIDEPTILARSGLDRIRMGGGTNCGLCHQGETFSRTVDGSSVFKSELIKFAPIERVPIENLRNEAVECENKNDSSDRCLIFRALFDLSPVSAAEI